jgi:hypothetical protein
MEGTKTLSVGVVIVTLNAEREVEPALRAVLGSSVVSRCLVMDSSSTDGTVALAKRLGAEVHILPRAEFNHGATREKARKLLATDIVVLLTQDVIPEADFIAELIKPIRCGETVAAYSRQLPHLGAEFFEAFPREFNYPATGNVRSISDTSKHGVYAFFCSDSAAAYSNEALDRIGGFEPTLTNEDYFAVARLLRAGGADCLCGRIPGAAFASLHARTGVQAIFRYGLRARRERVGERSRRTCGRPRSTVCQGNVRSPQSPSAAAHSICVSANSREVDRLPGGIFLRPDAALVVPVAIFPALLLGFRLLQAFAEVGLRASFREECGGA